MTGLGLLWELKGGGFVYIIGSKAPFLPAGLAWTHLKAPDMSFSCMFCALPKACAVITDRQLARSVKRAHCKAPLLC